MEIIYVNKPLQDATTIEPQIIDGNRYDWCVLTESARIGESFREWWDRKQDYIKSLPDVKIAQSKGEVLFEGIFLYNVEPIGGIVGDPKSAALHIRYAWIKPIKDVKPSLPMSGMDSLMLQMTVEPVIEDPSTMDDELFELLNLLEDDIAMLYEGGDIPSKIKQILEDYEKSEDINEVNYMGLVKSQAAILLEREWNYYFDVGTEVMLDKRILPSEEGETFHPIKLRPFVGKVGVVKKVGSDLHAFCCGTSYYMNIEFDGELVENIWAPYVMENKDE